MLAVRLWGRLAAETLAGCSLLPQGVQPPAAHFFSSRDRNSGEHPLEAAAAFFCEDHIRRVLNPLRLSSASHPRLHSTWQLIFTLLVPGFPASKVDSGVSLSCLLFASILQMHTQMLCVHVLISVWLVSFSNQSRIELLRRTVLENRSQLVTAVVRLSCGWWCC